jgi:hypothetical protein
VPVEVDEAGLARCCCRDDRDLTDPEVDERVDSRESGALEVATVVRDAAESLGGAGARLGALFGVDAATSEGVTATEMGDVGGDVAVARSGGRTARGESSVAAMAASESVRALRDSDGEAVRPRSSVAVMLLVLVLPVPLLLLAGPRSGRPVAALRSSDGLEGAAIDTSCVCAYARPAASAAVCVGSGTPEALEGRRQSLISSLSGARSGARAQRSCARVLLLSYKPWLSVPQTYLHAVRGRRNRIDMRVVVGSGACCSSSRRQSSSDDPPADPLVAVPGTPGPAHVSKIHRDLS